MGCLHNEVLFAYRNLNSTDTFDYISFKTLKNNYSKYQGKNIELIGIYKFSFEKSALYPVSVLGDDSKHAIWINFHKDVPLINNQTGVNLLDSYKEFDKITNRRIRIRGKLNMNSKGHLGSYFGELNNVVSIEVVD
jgi:hypothetical protein